MALEEKRQELSREAAQPRGKEERERVSSPAKEEKKDTSIFSGKPDMEASNFKRLIKEDKSLYSRTDLSSARRGELGEKLFGSCGNRIDPGEIENTKKELALGKWGKFKDFSHKDKEDAKRLIRELEK